MNKELKIGGYIARVCEEHPNYAVTQCLRVFRISTQKEMKHCKRVSSNPKTSQSKYYYIRVCSEGKRQNAVLHRLAAKAWVYNDDPVNKVVVNHINGDSWDCQISNLEWVTPSANKRHSVLNDLEGKGEKLYNSTLTDELAHELCKRLVEGSRPVDLAKEYGLTPDVVRKLKAGDTWFHVRNLYEVPHTYVTDFSTSTVHWVCEQIEKDLSDREIAKISNNSKLKVIDVKRIRYKIRYKTISDMYF